MVQSFFAAHRFLAYLAGAGFFALSGYGLARLDPKNPVGACTSWAMALLWLAFDLATTRSLLPVGPVLGLGVLVGGVAWMARYYERHRRG